MGSCVIQQRTGFAGHISNNGCVRYPELVTFNGTSWNFGKFLTHERPQRGGFLSIFWDVPRADTHAVEDIGAVDWLTERCVFHADAKSSLAVLHNRNDDQPVPGSNWVSESQDSMGTFPNHVYMVYSLFIVFCWFFSLVTPNLRIGKLY